LPRPKNSAISAVQMSTQCDATTSIAAAPPRTRRMKPVAINETSRNATCFSLML
jgi:hypothetical protein